MKTTLYRFFKSFNQGIMKSNRKKQLLSIVRFIIIVLLLISIGKLLCFELLTNVSDLRKHVGQKVIYDEGNSMTYEGVLKECRYEINDKLGFFSLRVTIDGTKNISTFKSPAGISTSLSAFDVKKIKLMSLPVDHSTHENTDSDISADQN